MRSFNTRGLALSFILVGCGGIDDGGEVDDIGGISIIRHRDEVSSAEKVVDEVPPYAVLTWWASDSLAEHVDAIAAGTAYWADVGVAFVPVKDGDIADVRFFYGDADWCVLEEERYEDTVLLGIADGETGMVVLCIDNLYGESALDPERLREIVAHETGHVLGVDHLSETCGIEDEDAVLLFDGEGDEICGDAIMNPFVEDVAMPGLTESDREAFAVRVAEESVMPSSTAADGGAGETRVENEWHPCYARRAR